MRLEGDREKVFQVFQVFHESVLMLRAILPPTGKRLHSVPVQSTDPAIGGDWAVKIGGVRLVGTR
jgi:hypothetical protein